MKADKDRVSPKPRVNFADDNSGIQRKEHSLSSDKAVCIEASNRNARAYGGVVDSSDSLGS
jgi:hypothetical protein